MDHGLSQHAVDIARPLGIPVTNSILVTWAVALGYAASILVHLAWNRGLM